MNRHQKLKKKAAKNKVRAKKQTTVGLWEYLATMAERRHLDGLPFALVATPDMVKHYGWAELERLVRGCDQYRPEHFLDPATLTPEEGSRDIPMVVYDPQEPFGGLMLAPFKFGGVPVMALIAKNVYCPQVEFDHHYESQIGHQRGGVK